ncbi:loricrin-like [Macrosteles quadrilineatus]|uniref:loricrin-like n=1 Tax=Macrosteles quadrilineatus TaxID=74068 RepID=UPI0023E2AB2F|nr:loricrin-like [Macrosteles quadrilineatus]
MRWAGYITRKEDISLRKTVLEMENNPEGRRPYGRPIRNLGRRRMQDAEMYEGSLLGGQVPFRGFSGGKPRGTLGTCQGAPAVEGRLVAAGNGRQVAGGGSAGNGRQVAGGGSAGNGRQVAGGGSAGNGRQVAGGGSAGNGRQVAGGGSAGNGRRARGMKTKA